jgi:hypothetical protein
MGGRRAPLASLLREPQASLPPLRGPDGAQEDNPAAAAAHTIADDAGPAPRAAKVRFIATPRRSSGKQLDTLGTQQLVWHGQIWPKQPMQWEIA